MELFALDTDVNELVWGPATQERGAQIERLLALTWYQRQSNNEQALQWVATLENELLPKIECGPLADRAMARCFLIKAETKWLETELKSADHLIDSALKLFAAHNDHIGTSDSLMLRALVSGGNGDIAARDGLLASATESASLGNDGRRIDYLRANRARFASLQNLQIAEAKWPDLFFDNDQDRDPYVLASIAALHGTREYLLGNYVHAIEAWERAYRWALATGQVAAAVTASVNIGGIYEVLNDHAASLEGIERALELARPTNWSHFLGPAMRQRAEVLCNMGHYASANDSTTVARQHYSNLKKSRNYGMVLNVSGDIAQRQKDHLGALTFYTQCAELARNISQPDLLIDGLLGASNVHLAVHEVEKAETCANEAMRIANESGVRLLQTKAVRLLAKVAKARNDPHAEREHLRLAVSHAESIQGYLIPHEVLIELANAYADDGRFELAYATAVRAHDAREKVLSDEAGNRAMAMQIRIAGERSRAEVEHQRQLATLEAHRASALQAVNETLQELTEELRKKNQELDQLSNTDRLTGLANRMRLDAGVEQEIARSQRCGEPFALILLDIDKFKCVNDTFGHPVGDRVLIEVGRLLQRNVRPYDIVGRWGGEEFLVICSNTDLESAVAVAEKLRAAMEGHVMEDVGARTGSFGVGVHLHDESISSLLGRTDAALYRAKEGGRNRVMVG